ncbi:MAG: hypothetical protein IJM59_04265 [Proteobacteria bacterium]|nr:hypothetical protein [Pseudomonadota bacterium]
MKKLFPVLFALPFILTSCHLLEKFQSEGETPTPAEAPAATAKDAPADTNAEQPAPTPETQNPKDAAPADAPAPEAPDAPDAENAPANADPDAQNAAPTEAAPIKERIVAIHEIFNHEFAKDGLQKAEKHAKLKVKHKKSSEWLDTDKWLEDNQFEKPELNRVEDGYAFEGKARSMPYEYQYNILMLGAPDGSVAQYDFSAFANAENDVVFTRPFIHYAVVKDDTLYVSIAHRTYSKMNPNTAFIIAMDLEGNVLWRSKTLVCNAQNFLIIDDTIICGYGFTDEPDFVYTLDRNTGAVIDKIPLRSGPDYFILSDGVIRLSTYNTDYTLSYK